MEPSSSTSSFGAAAANLTDVFVEKPVEAGPSDSTNEGAGGNGSASESGSRSASGSIVPFVPKAPSDFLSYGSLLTPEKHQGIAKRLLSLHDSKLLNPLPLHLSSTPVILSLHYAVANITEKVYTYLEKIVAVEHVYIEEKSLWEKMGVGMRDDVNGIIVKWKKLAIELDCLGNIVASFLTERHSVSSNRSRASLLAAVSYLKESWEGCVENDGFMFGENEKLEANETMFWEVTQALLDTKLWVERATGEKDWDVKLVAGNKIIQFAEKKKDYLNGL